jgi:phosphoribosyl-AMP cyclohydrolase
MSQIFASRGSHHDVEEGAAFAPKFDEAGLIAAIVTDAVGGGVLMFAYMNEEALAATIETGVAHFWSRSRKSLWRKGETSGHEMSVAEMRIDCDQDALWLSVTVAGTGAACHTGRKSCFYRAVPLGTEARGASLVWTEDERLFDPAAIYKD